MRPPPPGSTASLTDLLCAGEELLAHQWLVPALVLDALEGDDADVLAVLHDGLNV
jgi:hypothetical protein